MNRPYPIIATSAGSVAIRPAMFADAIQFSELRQAALRDNPTLFGSDYDSRENCTIEWTLKLIQANPQEECSFVAACDQLILGMTGIRRFPGQKLRHSATIGGVYIQPQWRRQGLAFGLLAGCLDWAREHEIVSLKLAVVTTNLAAIQLYEQNGFIKYGREPRVIFHAGVYYDEYLMSYEV
ncbi:MAG: GNAT family N-acetyltransferase [Chloroflexi bacterium]|nr:GNAT family N-acetyltransferase [Chloroflexota bacterium]